jgi:hypothetical protein
MPKFAVAIAVASLVALAGTMSTVVSATIGDGPDAIRPQDTPAPFNACNGFCAIDRCCFGQCLGAAESCCTSSPDFGIVCSAKQTCCHFFGNMSAVKCCNGVASTCTEDGECHVGPPPPPPAPFTPAPFNECAGACSVAECCFGQCLRHGATCCSSGPDFGFACSGEESCCHFFGNSSVKCCPGATSTCRSDGQCIRGG